MTSSNNLEQGLSAFLPENAVADAAQLLEANPCHIHISKPRTSKRGDFRPAVRKGEQHRISVNGSLNPYSFLITLIHEVAHLRVWNDHGRKVKPHGKEWQGEFRNLLMPYLEKGVFPRDIEQALDIHLARPSASSCTDVAFLRVLNSYDSSTGTPLEEIELGQTFQFRNRIFKKGEKRRTRYLCFEIPGERKFTFHPLTEVTEISTDHG